MNREYSVNIIIIGTWSSKLFSPAWVLKNLFLAKDNDEFKVAFEMDQLDVAYEYKKILFLPRTNLIEIRLIENSEENFFEAVEIYNKIIDLFKHIFIKGVGINIDCKFPLASEDDNILLSKALLGLHNDFNGVKINSLTLKIPRKDCILNIISVINNNENHGIKFNYHFDSGEIFDASVLQKLVIESLKNIQNGNFND